MGDFYYIKSQIGTVTYEDTRNCFQSLDFFVRKFDEIIENMIIDLGSDHRWIVHDIQTKLTEIHKKNKKHWFNKGDEEEFDGQKHGLIETINEFYESIEPYEKMKNWIHQNT